MSDTILSNSIWPNGMKTDSEGYACFYPLGDNKTSIPTSSSEWPKGNKLVSPFVYQDDKLVGFCDTKAMEVGNATTIVMPYEHIEADFSSIDKGTIQIATPKATFKKASWKNSGMEDIPEAQYKYKGCKTVDDIKAVDSNYKTTDIVDGTCNEILCDLEDGNGDSSKNWVGGMFVECSKLTTFTSDLSSLTEGICMFYGCTALTSFNSDLSSLTNGYRMFESCDNLTTFTSDLSSLVNGTRMFYECDNLTTFTSDLGSLTNGDSMFAFCTGLTTFDVDLSSLTDGTWMFAYCTGLTTFDVDLSSLTKGDSMFSECSELTTFTSDLSSLTNGFKMFGGCKLGTESLIHIAETINNVRDIPNGRMPMGEVYRTIHIGIGNTTPNEQEETAFNTIASKGWTVYVNGSEYTPASSAAITTLDENGEETTTPIPFYAKPVQTTKEHASYTDSEGNFFNIRGAQFIYGDDISTYGMFTCEEDAAAQMRLTPYTKPQTETTNN